MSDIPDRASTGSIGVVAPVYNGVRHVRQQLESILSQSLLPDVLLVVDDGSEDGTFEIVRDVVAGARVNLQIHRGEHVGLRRNVQRALELIRTDIVVLSDQDDVWMPDRLAAIRSAFANPAVTLWFSNAALIDERGNALGATTWESVRLDSESLESIAAGRGVSRLIHGQTVTGATMAVRRSVLGLALPLPDALDPPDHLMLHDGWLALIAALEGTVIADPHLYTLYRQHPAQLTGMSMSARDGGRGRNALHIDRERVGLVLERLRERDALSECEPVAVRWLLDAEAFYTVRAMPRGWKRVWPVLKQGARGSYHVHAAGWRTLVFDMMPVPLGSRDRDRPGGSRPPTSA